MSTPVGQGFVVHMTDADKAKIHEAAIKIDAAVELLRQVNGSIPDRRTSLAITNIEQGGLWLGSVIADIS